MRTRVYVYLVGIPDPIVVYCQALTPHPGQPVETLQSMVRPDRHIDIEPQLVAAVVALEEGS